MRNALPNAHFIGFTGTPLFKEDEITRQVFGEYVSVYDFQRAVEDQATLPLYYDTRGDELNLTTDDLNERIADKLETFENDDIDVTRRLERELKRDYHIITASQRLDQIARDFVKHYSTVWETGKAMFICIDKVTCVRMYQLIEFYWREQIKELQAETGNAEDKERRDTLQRQIDWMNETRMAVVISEEQGEVEKFREWELDILPHRKLIKEGMELPEAMRHQPQYQNMQRLALDDAFKSGEHPFRIAIVCAMWLTGFDVPSLSTLYLDKPLKAHTLMQAIARANRVNKGKNNGLIVDYCGILKHLRKALATFAVAQPDDENQSEPTRPVAELLQDLNDAIALVRDFLNRRNASLDDVIEKTGFERIAAIDACKEAANENDETRKRFEIMCRQVFVKFRACITVPGINDYRTDYGAVNIVYKSLQAGQEKADISEIIQQLHKMVDESIDTQAAQAAETSRRYDISKIDFEKLQQEFSRCQRKKTIVQDLKSMVEQRLKRLLQQNPLRTNLQKHYEAIIEDYNRERDRVEIEKIFEALIKFVRKLGKEENRALREGLDEESLAVFDLLHKPDLSSAEIKHVKEVAQELLETLKEKLQGMENWTAKETTRDTVKSTIHDFLWQDTTGLQQYTEDEIKNRADEVYRHIFRAYPTLPSPYYETRAA